MAWDSLGVLPEALLIKGHSKAITNFLFCVFFFVWPNHSFYQCFCGLGGAKGAEAILSVPPESQAEAILSVPPGAPRIASGSYSK